MKHIKLTQGHVAIVDDSDYETLNQLNWYYSKQGYAMRNRPMIGGVRKGHISMHRTILPPSEGNEVDHINGNKLDNRRSNLRVVSRSTNMHNKVSSHRNTSGYRGVCWDKSRQKWMAFISFNKKRKTIGRYDTPEEAAIAYNSFAETAYPGSRWINEVNA